MSPCAYPTIEIELTTDSHGPTTSCGNNKSWQGSANVYEQAYLGLWRPIGQDDINQHPQNSRRRDVKQALA
jgi:hypothetical protein